VFETQSAFDAMTGQGEFGIRNGLILRPWQQEARDAYVASVTSFNAIHGHEKRHDFLLVAGTGAGKTKVAGEIASYLLNEGLVKQLVVVSPNDSVMIATQADFEKYFGIILGECTIKNSKLQKDWDAVGCFLSYQKLRNHVDVFSSLTRIPTAVIFDEVHHLADDKNWGKSAHLAFQNAKYSLSLSGTPFRGDRREITYLTYVDHPSKYNYRICRADFKYALERAIADEFCRKPVFIRYGGTVRLPNPDGFSDRTVTFDDDLSPVESARRLSAAVSYGSLCRTEMLATALEDYRKEGRKVIIFLGGRNGSMDDAKTYLPDELRKLGINPDSEYRPMVGKFKKGSVQPALDRWCSSAEEWILAVDGRATEGTNIPQASAGIMLSSKNSALINIQRWGRLLRRQTDDVFPMIEAPIAVFNDPRIISQVIKIEKLIDHELEMKEARTRASSQPGQAKSMDGIGIGGTQKEEITTGSNTFNAKNWDMVKCELKAAGMPTSVDAIQAALYVKGLL